MRIATLLIIQFPSITSKTEQIPINDALEYGFESSTSLKAEQKINIALT
jgi:hypothetical protein